MQYSILRRTIDMKTIAALLATVVVVVASTCPDGIAIGETTEGETVCERLDGTGDLIFLNNTDGIEQRRVAKNYAALFDTNASAAYLGFNKSQWGKSSGPDVIGNALLARSKPADPSCTSFHSVDSALLLTIVLYVP